MSDNGKLSDVDSKAIALAIFKLNLVPTFGTNSEVIHVLACDGTGTEEEIVGRVKQFKVWLSLYKGQHPDSFIPQRVAYRITSASEVRFYLSNLIKLFGYPSDSGLVDRVMEDMLNRTSQQS